jgi:deferrochelatase/peroxidase EfeB
MVKRLQDGIFYMSNHNISINNNNNSSSLSNDNRYSYNKSFAILFLKFRKKLDINILDKSLEKLWNMYNNLKKGKVKELPDQKVPHGSLSIILGYGQNIFTLEEIGKEIPRDFKNSQFLPPRSYGGYILERSKLSYSKDLHENVGLNEDIIIQFVANTQLAVNRAILETWKHIRDESSKNYPLIFSKFFTGFQRDDGRSWLDFHDEISNMRPGKERRNVIAIHRENNELISRDFWTEYGTYMAFLRIEIDIDLWDSINKSKQELIIGRDKLNGRPIIGVDKSNNPITYKNTPIARKVTAYNKKYHDHPDYFKKLSSIPKEIQDKIDINKSFKVLNESHIGRTRHFDKIKHKLVSSRRIYRQGFEFIESNCNSSSTVPIKVGLNFLSFQNDPARLLFILTDPNWLGNSSFGGDSQFKDINNLLHVQACGIFFIPKMEKPFPGFSIFKQLQ